MRRLAHLEAADTHGKQEATDLQITFCFTELKARVFPLKGSAVVSTSLQTDRPSFFPPPEVGLTAASEDWKAKAEFAVL